MGLREQSSRNVGMHANVTRPRRRRGCPAQDSRYALHALRPPAIRAFDVVTFASPSFWLHHQPVVEGFFANLRAVRSSGLLISRNTVGCDRATAANIPCATSCHHADDWMLSKERWHVVRYFLSRNQSVLVAGADVRFLRPARRLFQASGDVDMMFDGRVANGRLTFFTPDVLIAFATTRAIAFVEKILDDVRRSEAEDPEEHVRGVRAVDVDGAANLQVLRSRPMPLTGPAEQDLLFDTLVSYLYGRQLWARKRYVARIQLGLPLENTAEGGRNALEEGRFPYSHQLPELPMRARRHGVLVRAPSLTLFITNDTMVRDGEFQDRKGKPCGTCDDWDPVSTLALHCNRKLPECLNISQCTCLHGPLRSPSR